MKRKYSGSYGRSNRRRLNGGTFRNLLIAGQGMFRMYNNRKKANTQTVGGGVTSQYDKTLVYRKKRMPYKKRKQWKSFVYKVRAALLKDIGTKTVIRNGQMTQTFATDGQGILAATLYGFDGAAGTAVQQGQDDIKRIFLNDAQLSDPTAKALFMSGILDLTMTNQSTTTTGQNTGLEVDIYDLTFRRVPDGNDPINWLNSCTTRTGSINALNPNITLSDRGVTPFEIPDASSLGMKILSKKKYFLGAGQCAIFQLRDPKNRQFRTDFVDDGDNNWVVKGVTRTLLIIIKGVPTATPTEVLKALQVGVTRKYAYKVVQSNTDQDNIIP